MKSFIVSLFVFAFLSPAQSQISTKKYLRKNKDARTFRYGDSTIYARGLLRDTHRLFIGNSDGAIYYVNLVNMKSTLVFKLQGFDEVRDIEKTSFGYIGIHSGTNGKMVQLDLSGKAKIIADPRWKGVFIDAIDFYESVGFMMGDPVDSLFSLYYTCDNGNNWIACENAPVAHWEEAGFAASGTNVKVVNDSTFLFITGGMSSRFFKTTNRGKSWEIVKLPYYPGKTTGAYSMCFANDSSGVIVGGDYKDPGLGMNTAFYSLDGGESWLNASTPPRGYRSCVVFKSGVYYACGTNGIDVSFNQGLDWIPFADGSYFALTASDTELIATGPKGTLTFFELLNP